MEYKESTAIRFLYNTFVGRCILKLFIQPKFSEKMYHYLSSPLSKWMIPYYINKYDIDMSQYHNKKYVSFNDFFTRRKMRQFDEADDSALIAPCDGYLSVYKIQPELKFMVKHVEYDIEALLDNKELAKSYNGGYCMIFRLAPYNYHRYIYIDDGQIEYKKRINGVLHCVRPEICGKLPVYIMNTREYTVTKSRNFGKIVQMEVGALLVGRISNSNSRPEVCRYLEKGYFEFGGSTIILLFEKSKVVPYFNILKNSASGIETPVEIGKTIGRKNQGSFKVYDI